MKVIERKEPRVWSRQIKCTGVCNPKYDEVACGSILEIERDDLRFYSGDSGYFERDNAVVMRCPVCGSLTDLNHNDWPRESWNLKEFSTHWEKTGEDKPNESQ